MMDIGRAMVASAMLLGISACAHFEVREADLLHPDDPPALAALPEGYEIKQYLIQGADRAIGVTYAHRAGNKVLVQYCGGNAFRRSRDGGRVLEHLARGADVVLFDYPGYGDSTGSPGVATILEDARVVYDHFAANGAADGRSRMVYGFSLGGFVASALAGARDPDVAVLEATAPDVESWANGMVPWLAKPFVRVSVSDELASLDNVEALADARSRVFVLGGGKDKEASAELNRAMAAALAQAGVDVQFERFPGAAHGEIMATPEFPAFWAGVVDGAANGAKPEP